jgi:hypothetical protein
MPGHTAPEHLTLCELMHDSCQLSDPDWLRSAAAQVQVRQTCTAARGQLPILCCVTTATCDSAAHRLIHQQVRGMQLLGKDPCAGPAAIVRNGGRPLDVVNSVSDLCCRELMAGSSLMQRSSFLSGQRLAPVVRPPQMRTARASPPAVQAAAAAATKRLKPGSGKKRPPPRKVPNVQKGTQVGCGTQKCQAKALSRLSVKRVVCT